MTKKPVVAGAHISVESILEKLAADKSKEQIFAEHPRLSEEVALAALNFALRALRADMVYPRQGEFCACWSTRVRSFAHKEFYTTVLNTSSMVVVPWAAFPFGYLLKLVAQRLRI